jgi:hypothetical protein
MVFESKNNRESDSDGSRNSNTMANASLSKNKDSLQQWGFNVIEHEE